MGIIRVQGIQVYANHGCMNEEALIGSDYEVNVELHTDFTEAATTDDLTLTIDYVKVNSIVAEEMAVRSKLLEHVALRIIGRLKSTFSELDLVRVNVAKLNPPINGNVARVSVEMEG